MSCLASSGVVFCQFTPLGFLAIAFSLVMLGVIIKTGTDFIISES